MCSLPSIQVYLGSMLYFPFQFLSVINLSFENVLLRLLNLFRADNFKTYESLWKHISEQLTIRKHAKAYENIMSVCSETGSDRHWSAKKQAPLTLPHVLKLTLDFISVYNSATIKRLSPSSQNATSHSPHHPLFKSWVENIWQMPAWSFPPN